MKHLLYVIAALYIVSSSGCTSVVRGMYGMKKYKELNDLEIQSLHKSLKIPNSEIYVLDTSYFSFMNQFRADHTFAVDNHVHPLQAIWYDKTGKQVSFHSGVWADTKMFTFDWNYKGQLNYYPPRTGAPIDTLFGFEEHLKYVRTLEGEKLDVEAFSGNDYNIVVHYARFPGRMTKKFLRVFAKNKKLNTRFKVNYIYVNTDNFYFDRSL